MRSYGSPAQLEQRRLQAVSLFEHEFTPVNIAKKLKVDRRSVRRWKSTYLKKRVKGIKTKPASDRPSRMSTRNKSILERYLLRGAMSDGYATDLWTCPRIANFIKDKFRIHYHFSLSSSIITFIGMGVPKSLNAVPRNEMSGS